MTLNFARGIVKTNVIEAVLCHYSENNISPKIIEKLNFQFKNSIISEVSKKEIKCYTKKLKVKEM